jgi:hypothetical protein
MSMQVESRHSNLVRQALSIGGSSLLRLVARTKLAQSVAQKGSGRLDSA